MIIILLLKSAVLFLTLFHSAYLTWQTYQNKILLPLANKVKLGLSGVVAFLADTIGVGSFAINIAFAKIFKLMPTDKLPGYVNASQVLPGTIQAFIFMTMVNVDMFTLATLAIAASIGGILGAIFVSKMNATLLKKLMIFCFAGMIVLLFATEAGLLNISGDAAALSGMKLFITAIAMTIAGALTAACVGLYATSQAILFLAGISPLAAFPIMMAAGALQQPLLAITFLTKNKVPVKETLIVSITGLIGIAIGLPLITSVSIHFLHYLLICVLLYNIFSIASSLKQDQTLSLESSIKVAR